MTATRSVIAKINPDFTAAILACMGEYGTGEERKEALTLEGYDAERVQKIVNDIFPIMKKYGVV